MWKPETQARRRPGPLPGGSPTRGHIDNANLRPESETSPQPAVRGERGLSWQSNRGWNAPGTYSIIPPPPARGPRRGQAAASAGAERLRARGVRARARARSPQTRRSRPRPGSPHNTGAEPLGFTAARRHPTITSQTRQGKARRPARQDKERDRQRERQHKQREGQKDEPKYRILMRPNGCKRCVPLKPNGTSQSKARVCCEHPSRCVMPPGSVEHIPLSVATLSSAGR